MDSERKKELKNAFRAKPAVGGVYRIRCAGNGRAWLKAAKNLEGARNRFEFAVSTDLCPEPGMRAEWERYGTKSFSFEVLEELKRKETQTEREFADDLGVLLELWQEKSEQGVSR